MLVRGKRLVRARFWCLCLFGVFFVRLVGIVSRGPFGVEERCDGSDGAREW